VAAHHHQFVRLGGAGNFGDHVERIGLVMSNLVLISKESFTGTLVLQQARDAVVVLRRDATEGRFLVGSPVRGEPLLATTPLGRAWCRWPRWSAARLHPSRKWPAAPVTARCSSWRAAGPKAPPRPPVPAPPRPAPPVGSGSGTRLFQFGIGVARAERRGRGIQIQGPVPSQHDLALQGSVQLVQIGHGGGVGGHDGVAGDFAIGAAAPGLRVADDGHVGGPPWRLRIRSSPNWGWRRARAASRHCQRRPAPAEAARWTIFPDERC
jgi:hypothetical protein